MTLLAREEMARIAEIKRSLKADLEAEELG